ncbi:hypothetical protein EUX98_g6711 [Antrodiella citrinella]|uniref:Uncharacterized protein n=1 Tax=Antrodiella citrinella TaxID=2447956 RepID=A0A4S4MQ37_9APHY|nr:hypothetical protein EUX98_g6711 [Antrodiella citrinella]
MSGSNNNTDAPAKAGSKRAFAKTKSSAENVFKKANTGEGAANRDVEMVDSAAVASGEGFDTHFVLTPDPNRELAISSEEVEEFSELLVNLDEKYFVLGAFAGTEADSDAANALVAQVVRALEPGRWASVEEAPAPFDVQVTRKHNKGVLLSDRKGGFRYAQNEIDFIQFADPLYFWPPPLASCGGGKGWGNSASAMWIADGKAGEVPSLEDLRAALNKVGATTGGFFRLFKHTQGEGNRHLPVDSWALRAVKRGGFKGSDFKVGANSPSWLWRPHCGYCGRGAPYETAHTHLECPFVGTQNKFGAAKGLKPIVLEDGALVRVDEEEDIPVAKTLRELRSAYDALRTRVDGLEKIIDPKGKRKADAPPAEDTKGKGNQAPSKKAKTSGGSGGGTGANAIASGSGGGKGKGKGGAKKATK